jgi:hypothetical protein
MRQPSVCEAAGMDATPASVLLLAATGVHLGFQLVVTLLVYPGFAEVADEHWASHHDRHSRRITPLVVIVYGLLVVACALALVTGPTALQTASVASCGVAAVATAAVAAPAHSRLAAGRDPALLRRLLYADRVRLLAAAVAAVLSGISSYLQVTVSSGL